MTTMVDPLEARSIHDFAHESSTPAFEYDEAFSRNLGWVTEWEQQELRRKKVAVAGAGGVGGVHLLALARLGIGKFHIADPDVFELANFNRQAGATVASLNQPKAAVMSKLVREINAEAEITVFNEGVVAGNESNGIGRNVDEFLDGVDLFIDGFDFFVLKERAEIFQECARRRIPGIIAGPLGMGVAYLVFMPGKMTFEEYFQLSNHSPEQQQIRFLLGLSPKALHRGYIRDWSRIDFAARRVPSTGMACQLCAGVAGVEALKILLGRGAVWAAPWYHHFDAYRGKFARGWMPWGNRNPLQLVRIAVTSRLAASLPARSRPAEPASSANPIEAILEVARWAPSGDNMQPWRFEVIDDRRIVVHGADARDRCIYDMRGRATLLALGALFETMQIAASEHGWLPRVVQRAGMPAERPTFDIEFEPRSSLESFDPLLRYVPIRSTQRRAMSTRVLSDEIKDALALAIGPRFKITWLEGWRGRCQGASLMSQGAKLRLTLPEAYPMHVDCIDWNKRFSRDRIPDHAIGLDPLMTRLMRWAMRDWKRIVFLNRFCAGTVLPRLELDTVPGLFCAAHFVIHADAIPSATDDFITGGRALQRFWLTATSLGLQLQPETTPMIFSWYVREKQHFSSDESFWSKAVALTDRFEQVFGAEAARNAVFVGRIGHGNPPKSRSLRLSLRELLRNES